MIESNFKIDLQNEQILTKWIVNNFIAVEAEKYEVIEEEKTQHTGVDFVLTSEDIFGYNLPYKVDFKAALTYTRPLKDKYNNKPRKMPTFAFELSALNKYNKEREGWLFGDKYNNTEYYMLAWVWVDLPFHYNESGYIAIDMEEFNYESIKEVEIMVIRKESLQNYARKYSIDEEAALIKSNEMRSNETKEIHLVDDNKFPKLHYSSFLAEKPVNLVIHTKVLEEMAIFHKIITELPINQRDTEVSLKQLNSSIEYSCKLFNQRHIVSEIMKKRTLAQSTVIDHLYIGAMHGLLQPVPSGLSEKNKKHIRNAIQKNGNEQLNSIKHDLDEKLGVDAISYNDIKQYIIEVYSNK